MATLAAATCISPWVLGEVTTEIKVDHTTGETFPRIFENPPYYLKSFNFLKSNMCFYVLLIKFTDKERMKETRPMA